MRVDHTVVSGTFSLDGQAFDVRNNVWVIGDDEQRIVVDAPHDVDAIPQVVAGRPGRSTHGSSALLRVTAAERATRIPAGAAVIDSDHDADQKFDCTGEVWSAT